MKNQKISSNYRDITEKVVTKEDFDYPIEIEVSLKISHEKNIEMEDYIWEVRVFGRDKNNKCTYVQIFLGQYEKLISAKCQMPKFCNTPNEYLISIKAYNLSKMDVYRWSSDDFYKFEQDDVIEIIILQNSSLLIR